MRGVFFNPLLILVFMLQGCATVPSGAYRAGLADEIAISAGFTTRRITTSFFTHTTCFRIKRPQKTATVYIEGDGFAWKTRHRVSADPTPKDPLVLRLAARDPAENVIYIARPGQYSGKALPDCDHVYWTDRRFSGEVITSVDQVFEDFKKEYQLEGFHLIGYSGGAAVAVLVAARRSDILSLRTLAGNLDHRTVNEYHKVSPLEGSLNPIDYARKIKHIPQRHFAGKDDRIVPAFIVEKFVKRAGNPSRVHMTLLDGVNHRDGWEEQWDKLQHRLGSALEM